MADLEALRDAEALLEQSSELVARIEREVALMEAALAEARADLERIERIALAAAERVSELCSALSEGRQLQRKIEEGLVTVTQAAWTFEEIASATSLERSPSLIGIEQERSGTPAGLIAELPSLRILDGESLREAELRPVQSASETWDTLAGEFKTLEESFRAAMELLDEAESLVAAKRRRLEDRRFREKAGPRKAADRLRD